MADVKSGDVVVPGDQLCVIEELSPGFGTYEQEGIVYAAASGAVHINLKERSIKVLEADGSVRIALPMKGDTLVGEVVNAYEQRAEVSLVKRNDADVPSPFIGEIHISSVTRRYVKSMFDVIKPGDIVRAMATNTHTIPVQLTLIGPKLGVLLAKCSKCGNSLSLTTGNNLVCSRCENRETREVASDYGQRFGVEARPDLAPRKRSYDERRNDGERPRRDREAFHERRTGRSSEPRARGRGPSSRPVHRRSSEDDTRPRGRRQ
jgi:exosome complex component CSL4